MEKKDKSLLEDEQEQALVKVPEPRPLPRTVLELFVYLIQECSVPVPPEYMGVFGQNGDSPLCLVDITGENAKTAFKWVEVQFQQELEEKEDAIIRLRKLLRIGSTFDELTELPDRSATQDELLRTITDRRRANDSDGFAVVFVDCKGFKWFNDLYKGVIGSGRHKVGDAVLKKVANTLRIHVRDHDFVGRWGGDEFLIILHDLQSLDVGLSVVKRCTKAVRRRSLSSIDPRIGDRNVEIDCGMVYCAIPNQIVQPSLKREGKAEKIISFLVDQADQMMYKAKAKHKRGTAVVYTNTAVITDEGDVEFIKPKPEHYIAEVD